MMCISFMAVLFMKSAGVKQKVLVGMCVHLRLRSACASVQSDQSP